MVLGFDAGCATCSDLAEQVEEAVGEKLEVRSLHDPRVKHWRRQALGEDAPWAPTLIEVGVGGEVKAWTGLRMGARLSRRLGPAATWRVIRVLGQVGMTSRVGVPSAATTTVGGLSRGQFLKSLGGAAVALSVLSGVGPFAASAGAQEVSSGTPAQRERAKQIVRSSEQLRALTGRAEKPFDFGRAEVAFGGDGDLAAVSVPAVSENKTGIVATFLLNLQEGTVFSYSHVESKRDGMRRLLVTIYYNGESVGRAIAEDDYAITPDGRRVSYEQLREETKRLKRANGVTARSACSDCLRNVEFYCGLVAVVGCAALGPISIPCGFLVVYADRQGAGCQAAARDWCYFEGPNTPCA